MSCPKCRLGDVCDITMGQAPEGASYNTNSDGLPLVAGAGDLGDLIPNPSKYTTAASKISRQGDIILCIRATIGDTNWSDRAYCLGRGVAGLRAKSNVLDQRFLWHFISARRAELEARGTGTTFKQVSRLDIADWLIPTPTLSEQQRIAAILDKADSVRRKRQEAIHLAHDFLRAVFIDMFGGLDIASNPTVRLADVVTLDAPMVDPTHEDFADLLHVGPDRIEKGNGQLMECETARAEGLISKKFLFDERYVLYSKIRPTLKKCALAEFRGLCSADMYPVRPSRDDMTREFIWGLLLSDVFDRYVSTLADRANIPKLNRAELNAFEFRLPPVELQRKYSAIVRRTMKMKRRHNTFLQQANSLPAALGFFD